MARKKANDEPDKGKLSFNQSLKAPNSAELLKRLKTLHKELSEIEQDAIDTASLDKVAKELINSTLLLHKEKAVKAFLATCLVDILRLYAPEPPYTDVELRDVFQFLIRQLKNVGDPTDAHAPEYFYSLESLANVKSIVIICDLDQSEDMMTDVFKQSFDIISSSTSKNVELNIADMLVQILEEADPIPASVVDILLTQFLPKNAKMKPSAYSLVKEVCAAASDKLQRHVVQYFAEIITSTIGGDRMSSDDESDNEKGKSSKSKRAKLDNLPNDFVVAHSLIRQINRTVPDLLLSVVPLLEKELEEEKVEVRKLATETLVGMAGEKVGNGDLAKRHPQVWKSLVKRVLDVSPAVRLALIAGLSKVWKEHQSLSNDIELVLDRMLFDPDEKVRLASAQLFEELDFETAYNHVSVKMLKLLGERCQDRRAAVRSAALSALGRLYSLAYSDIESKDEKVIEHFGWIPATVIGVTSLSIDLAGQNALRHTVDRVLLKYILPLPDKDDEDQEWVDRFLCVYSSLPEDAQKLLLSQSRLAERRPNWWDVFIDACERNNGGLANDDQIKKQLDGAIHASISRLPDQEKAKEALLKFAKANEKQLYKIMRTLMDVGTDVKTLVKNQKEALKRIEQISSTAVEPFTAFIYASSHFYINRSSITPLFKRLSTSKDDQSDEAFEILTYIAKNRPALFASHSAELTKAVSDGSHPRLSQVALHAAACLLRKAPAIKYSPDKKLSDRAKHYARNGNTMQSKHAATILALDKSRSASSAEVINDLSAKLSTASDGQLPGILAALARFARYDRVNFDAVSESVVKDVLEILHRHLKSSELVDEEDLAWFEDDELPERTKARELCLKVLTSHCLAYATAGDPEAAKTVSKPVFELLWKLMVQHEEGSIFNTPVAARLRLASSLAVLKLAPYPCFGTEISNHFLLLARMAQDMAFEVRYGYIHKLVNFFRSHYIKIPRYNMLLFLVAHDPEEDLRVEVESYVRHATSRLPDNARLPLWEHPFLRLIHLLAHHPDFAPDVAHDDAEELKVMAKYVQWYLELIATSQNISYLLHLSQIIKTMRDATDSDYDRNLYTMAELAQYLITQYAKTNSWPLETYPGEVKTPADVLRKIQDPAAAKRIASTAFIASDLLNDMSLGKTTVSAPKPAQRARAMESKPSKPRAPRKRSSPSTTKPKSTKPRKKAGTKSDKWNPNASDEEDEISSPSEDENDENSGNPRKKSKSPLPPAKQGTRTGLRNGSANRRPGKVAVPQKMRVKDNPLEEGISDSDAESMDADN